MTDEQNTREKAINTIRALRARAADEATSQAEAEAAASRAAKLIQSHEIKEAELRDLGVSGVSEGVHDQHRRQRHPTLRIALSGIAALTECTPYKRGGSLIWVGENADVEFALYLSELIQGAAERSWKNYAVKFPKGHGPTTTKARRSFLMGFGQGVQYKLQALAKERIEKREAVQTGTGLVVLKNALVDEYVEKNWGVVKAARSTPLPSLDMLSAMSGVSEGQKMNLQKPIETNSKLWELL